MKRKDLSLGIWCLFDKGDVRPSQFRKIKAVLPYDNGYFLRDLCQLSEADLLAYDCIDQSFVTLLKSKLAAAGLSLNMTEEQLVQYEDADYTEKHPELQQESPSAPVCQEEEDEANPFDDPSIFIPDNDDSQDEVQQLYGMNRPTVDPPAADSSDTQFVPLTDTLRQKILLVHAQKLCTSFEKEPYLRPVLRISPEDIQFLRLRLFNTLLFSQPWYIRLFMPHEKRLARTWRQTEAVLQRRLKAIRERWIKVQSEDYSAYITRNWETHWQQILKEYHQ